MMVRAALVLGLVGVILPAHGVMLWMKDTDYMDFTIMKSCFGEEVAVRLERFAYSVGQYCEETATSGNFLPVETVGERKKRSLLKLPQNPPPELVVCSLRQLGLLKDNNEVDNSLVEKALLGAPMDVGLKGSMLKVLTSCRSNQSELPDLLPGDPDNALVKALVTIGNYFTCVIDGGMETCRNFEMRRYFANFQ